MVNNGWMRGVGLGRGRLEANDGIYTGQALWFARKG